MNVIIKSGIRILGILIICSGTIEASNNFVFSVSSNPSINVGYKIGSFVIFGGTDFSYSKSEMKSNNPESSIYLPDNGYSVFKLEPSLGLKVFLFQKEISPFLIGNFSKEVPFIIESSGTYTDSQVRDQNDDYKFSLGSGLDFSIKDNLSVGFEVGINYLYSEWDTDLMENMHEHYFTYSRVTLNYYFL